MKTNTEYVTGIYLFSTYTCIDGEIIAEIRLKAFGGGFLFHLLIFHEESNGGIFVTG